MAHILVVDDDLRMREMIQRLLIAAGHVVDIASDGLEAERKLAHSGVDLVITDVVMPDKEGLTLLRELKLLRPALRVIVMSGGGRSGTSALLDVAAKFGADAVLQKPFRARALLNVIDRALAQGKPDVPLPSKGSE